MYKSIKALAPEQVYEVHPLCQQPESSTSLANFNSLEKYIFRRDKTSTVTASFRKKVHPIYEK